MRAIPQRELRDDLDRILREVEAGDPVRVTVAGRPVAELVPVGNTRRPLAPREDVLRLLERASLDRGFPADIEAASGATIDEL